VLHFRFESAHYPKVYSILLVVFLLSLELTFNPVISINPTFYNVGIMNNTRPIAPKPVFVEDTHYSKATKKIIKRFNLPIAKLTYSSSDIIKDFYSLDVYNSDERIDDCLSVDKIIYTLISSINYVTNDGHQINLTTLLMSHKARKLNYIPSTSTFSSNGSQSAKILKLKDGTDAVLFINNDRKNIASQIVFINSSSFITISSDLDSNTLIDIVSNYIVFED
jgi:hypothetical protein